MDKPWKMIDRKGGVPDIVNARYKLHLLLFLIVGIAINISVIPVIHFI